jgi:hypothetical protein
MFVPSDEATAIFIRFLLRDSLAGRLLANIARGAFLFRGPHPVR